jgi:uracil-DNA glycosylase family 4|tara:strand:- start:2638 stop:3309 length:672 start_codon:yes stop_codon:yes gene_type:complete
MNKLIQLNKKIIKCNKCRRLVAFRKKISKIKRKQYINETYWGKPVPGFGDPFAKILLVGLAPAAHGATRTGRVFTGDRSAAFLYNCLFKSKLANQPTSENKNDNLKLFNAYITLALKCVPPNDKPTSAELGICYNHFDNEIKYLNNIKIIVALGKIAFDTCYKFYRKNYKLNNNYKFIHGKKYILPDNKYLIGCYHPSPRNVNTKIINTNKMVRLFKNVQNLI